MTTRREKKRWEDQELSGINRREGRTSFYRDTVPVISLNGDWKFKYLEAPELSPEGFTEAGAEAKWDTIDVPSVWQLRGYDKMHYTDVLYLFPLNPPYVPTENPTGIYKKSFCLEEEWLKEDTVLRFYGVDSAFDVWINGAHVGYSKVSRMTSEFKITNHVHKGKNDITVRVYKWSDGTYLEDQDMWWFSGIYRDMELINEPKQAILDCAVNGDLDDTYKNGILKALITLKENTGRITWRLEYREKRIAGGDLFTENGKLHLEETVFDVKTWTAETPELYKLTVMIEGHEVQVRMGFRKIEMKNHNFLVNNQVILLNGVNHHDYNPKEGRCVTYEQMKEDVILMKRHNINALRCSHYPANDYFYDLCDEYGLYVIDEADLECHGFEWAENYSWITDDPSWKTAYVDRSIRMVKRNRNHPSIIMWSMGNESSFGCNFRDVAKEIRALDDTRLLHYEGDSEAEVTDVYSTMYTRLEGLSKIAKSHGKGNKPHIMCEYGHAMGNGPGGLQEYQHMFRTYNRLQGGFLWEWYDHGIYEDGAHTYYRYGGNYGDFPTNGNFCIDGVLMPDRTPSPALLEYKQIISPVEVTKVEGSMREVCLKNYYDFLSLESVLLRWSVKEEGTILEGGQIDYLSVKPHESEKVEIPFQIFTPRPNIDYYLDIEVCQMGDSLYARKGHPIARYQFLLDIRADEEEKRSLGDTLYIREEKEIMTVENRQISVRFHKIFGKLLSIELEGKTYVTEGPKMTVYRASIDNDMYKKEDWMNKYFIQKSSEQTEYYTCKEAEGKVIVSIGKYFGCLNQSWGYHCDYEYTIYSCGHVKINIWGKFVQSGKLAPPFLPRLGVVMKGHKKLQNTTWYGMGPGESYADSKAASYMGIYHNTVDGMGTKYVFPQEHGHREQVKWFAVGDGEVNLLCKMENLLGLNLSNHTDESLEIAGHPHEIQEAEDLIIHIDYLHAGLGSNSCGEEQLEKYKVKNQDFSMAFTFQVVGESETIQEARRRYVD